MRLNAKAKNFEQVDALL
jgi:pentatricopeptide repeat protein